MNDEVFKLSHYPSFLQFSSKEKQIVFLRSEHLRLRRACVQSAISLHLEQPCNQGQFDLHHGFPQNLWKCFEAFFALVIIVGLGLLTGTQTLVRTRYHSLRKF